MKKLTTITTACLAAAAMAAFSIADAEAGPQKKGKYGGNYASAEANSYSGARASIYPVFPRPMPPRPCYGSKCEKKVSIQNGKKKGKPSKLEVVYKQWSEAHQRNGARASARGPNAQANASAWADAWADTWIKEREGKKRGRNGHGGGGYGGPSGDSVSSSNNECGSCGGGGGGGHGGGSSSSSGTSAGASGGSNASASTGS